MTAFEQACLDVQTLNRRPSAAQLLRLYALFKQGGLGDVQGARPGGFDLAGNAKYDAWAAPRDTEPARAQADYVALVTFLRAAESRGMD